MKPAQEVVSRGRAPAFLLAALAPLAVSSGGRAAPLAFELSFPREVRAEAVDGRLFVAISRTPEPEPRLQFGKPGDQYRSTPFFGRDVEAMPPGRWIAVGRGADGYPLARLEDLPAGEYFVQGVLTVYTTFRRADGHVVKMHDDQWEGQVLQVSPGNLYSAVRKVRLDPSRGGTVRLTLDRKVPPIEPPPDTDRVKHVRFESALLSKFWGSPIRIGATILLPRDYEKNPDARYPVLYEQGHFSTDNPGGFEERPRLPATATERQKEAARQRDELSQAWLADDFPRMLYVTFQHPTPYYDDSYAIDSPNNGPYGEAITTELIPYIESRFRVIAEPWARVLSGGSTGGWESLALQIFHPDYFGGTFSYCPDPVDFHYFELVNIYDWNNAWHREAGFRRIEIPGERQADGLVLSTMREQLRYERALGSRGRSGEDWDCWQAVYGPVGDDGYFRPLFDPKTGAIDHEVAAYWREHTDLNAYLQKRWSEIGARLAGKLHIWTGEMDTYYLNDAVHLLEEFLSSAKPEYGGSIVYGPRQPHCWTGPESRTARFRQIADYVASRAPAGADRSWRR